MQRLRAGVIGLGVGERHIHGFRRAAAVDVVALCDMDLQKQSMAREKYPECRMYTHADDLLADPEIDVVAIASYDHHHAAQIVKAFDSGKHVFSEKPLCLRDEELRAIKEALSRNPGVRLSTNTVLRMSPRFRDLRGRIQNGELGRLYYAEADYNYGRLFKLREGWRGQIPDYSVMLGGGVHVVDLMLWLSGRRVVEVIASGNKICSAGYGFSTPDMVVAILRFDDGMLGKVTANFGCVYPHFHKVLIYGTEATFENGIESASLFRSRDRDVPPDRIDTPYPGIDKGDLIPGFIDAIRGIGHAEIEEEDLFATMEVCLAIDKSWREDVPVRLGSA
ncbi:MAG: Gfo/Idh/MocA family oxidoreductase [Rhodocyclales bacterium]|nr:Gfo/Idh/MocA family oxidoreductase [Rhodocyclales bacterium]